MCDQIKKVPIGQTNNSKKTFSELAYSEFFWHGKSLQSRLSLMTKMTMPFN
jgi:hypothetical protein